MWKVWWCKNIADYSIIVVNLGIKFAVIWLVDRIGYNSRTKDSLTKMIYIFVIQFLNIGPLVLLTNSNLSEYSIPFINRLKSGAFNDFTFRWYKEWSS